MATASRIDKRFVAGVLLGLGLSAWFFATVEWSELLAALLAVDPWWILLATIVMLAEWGLRGVRWAVLTQHIPTRMSLKALVSATMVGAALNTIVPLRGGDLVRPAIIARKYGLPYTTVFSTTLVERILDIVGVLAVIGSMVLLLPPELAESNTWFGEMRRWGKGAAVVTLVLIALTLVLGTGAARGPVERLVRPLPERVRDRALGLFDELVVGLAVVGNPLRVLLALIATLALWFDGLVAILCLFKAFDLDLPYAAGLFTEAALAASVALPQAPGYWGVFHVVLEKTLALWGAPTASAKAAALVFWAVSFGPVTIIGLIEAWREGLSFFDPKANLERALEDAAHEREKKRAAES